MIIIKSSFSVVSRASCADPAVPPPRARAGAPRARPAKALK